MNHKNRRESGRKKRRNKEKKARDEERGDTEWNNKKEKSLLIALVFIESCSPASASTASLLPLFPLMIFTLADQAGNTQNFSLLQNKADVNATLVAFCHQGFIKPQHR